MNKIEEKVHHIYFDNGIYKKITKKGAEEVHDRFYDSLIKYIPTMNNGLYKTYFSVFSFLEAIGLGNFQEKQGSGIFDFTYILQLPSDFNFDEWLYLEYEKQCNYLSGLPELTQKNLLNKINETLEYLPNDAVIDLVDDTINRYKTVISQVANGIIHHLAWNAVCSSISFDNIPHKIRPIIRQKLDQIDNSLLKFWYDARVQGIDLDSHRLCTRIQKRLMSDPEFLNSKWIGDLSKKPVTLPNVVENRKDLCDSQIIHYATLGILEDNIIIPCIIFTSDSKQVILERLSIQNSVIKSIISDKSSKLKICNGMIYIVDQKTCEIIDSINVENIKEYSEITLQIQS